MDDERDDDAEGTNDESHEGSWYADRFKVGQNAFQFQVDCGHEHPDDELKTVYFRLIANPYNARELFRLLGVGLLRYRDTYGSIDENDANGSPQGSSQ